MNTPTTNPGLRANLRRTLIYRPDQPRYEGADRFSFIAAYGMEVVLEEVFENWNGVEGLTVFWVFVPETQQFTHFTAKELGYEFDGKNWLTLRDNNQ